jgi:hypothetical protein
VPAYGLGISSTQSRLVSLNLQAEWGSGANQVPAIGTAPVRATYQRIQADWSMFPSRGLSIANTYLFNRQISLADGRAIYNLNIARTKWNWQLTRELSLRFIDVVLVGLSCADDAAVGPDRYTRRGRLDPFPLFDNFRIRRVNDFAHFQKHFPAPVLKFLDPGVEHCRGRFCRDGFFHMQSNLSPNLAHACQSGTTLRNPVIAITLIVAR